MMKKEKNFYEKRCKIIKQHSYYSDIISYNYNDDQPLPGMDIKQELE